jgi:hypothetical protein
VAAALAVEADGANADAIIRPEHFAFGHGAGHDHRGRRLAEEVSSSQFHNQI